MCGVIQETYTHSCCMFFCMYRKDFGKSRVCFKQLAVGIYGPAAPTTLASFKVGCSSITLGMARQAAERTVCGCGLAE